LYIENWPLTISSQPLDPNPKHSLALYQKPVTLPMRDENKLTLIKTIHTLIWIFFNVVIFYMLYAVITGKIDRWLWIGYGLFVLEGITLLVFKFFCPLTVMARKYSNSTKANFDIYIPNWLAKYNKPIYTTILVGIIIIHIVQKIK
jgi:hypothetical protein